MGDAGSSRATKWRAARIAMLGVALAFMVALIARLGPREIVEQVGTAGVGAVWLLVVYCAGTAIGALPWHVLVPARHRPSVGASIASRFAASGANAIVPLLGLGGEPLRLLWLRREHHAAGVAALVVDRLAYALASAMFLAVGALAAFQLAELPPAYAIGAAIGAGALLLIAIGAIWLVARHQLAGRLHRLLRRIRKRTTSEPKFGTQVDDELATMLARRRDLVSAFAISLLARVVLAAEVYVGFRVLGVELTPAMALVFAAVPVLLAFAGAVIPSQIGLQEGSQALVASALGIAPSTAVAVVLLQRIRQLVTGAIAWGLVVIPHGGRRYGTPAKQ